MAIEVSKLIETEQVILIASAKTRKEIPWYFRFSGKIRLHKLVPTWLMKRSNFLTNWLFGTTSKFEKELLKQILADTNPAFLTWALNCIVHWKNKESPKNIFHVHGTSDRILPSRFVTCAQKLKGGGHFMTLNKAKELNIILEQQLHQ